MTRVSAPRLARGGQKTKQKEVLTDSVAETLPQCLLSRNLDNDSSKASAE
jgi:hypothetical protein